MEQLKIVRYILFIASLAVMFINLMDCIETGRPYGEYILYVGTLLVISLCLLFVQKNWVLAVVLAVVGILTILDSTRPNALSGGVLFFIYSIRIADNKVYSFCIYFLTLMMVIGANIRHSVAPEDSINLIIAYSVLYLLDELLYNKGKKVIK